MKTAILSVWIMLAATALGLGAWQVYALETQQANTDYSVSGGSCVVGGKYNNSQCGGGGCGAGYYATYSCEDRPRICIEGNCTGGPQLKGSCQRCAGISQPNPSTPSNPTSGNNGGTSAPRPSCTAKAPAKPYPILSSAEPMQLAADGNLSFYWQMAPSLGKVCDTRGRHVVNVVAAKATAEGTCSTRMATYATVFSTYYGGVLDQLIIDGDNVIPDGLHYKAVVNKQPKLKVGSKLVPAKIPGTTKAFEFEASTSYCIAIARSNGQAGVYSAPVKVTLK